MAAERLNTIEAQVRELADALRAANLQPDAAPALDDGQWQHQEFLQALCQRFTGDGPPLNRASLQVNDHAAIPKADVNPVPSPSHVQRWGDPFDVGSTAEGQRIKLALGAGSGYYQEYRTWAPLVSHLIDLTAHLLRIAAHPAFSADSRLLIGPIATGLEHLSRQTLGALDVHRLHAKFAGNKAAGR